MMAGRVVSIDILRGIAVLQMIVWQIFDFFAKVDIYSDVPYYMPFFNMPINGIGLALFAFASGASVYISVTRRLKKKIRIKEMLMHSIKRYGGYILLSLVFTTFVFGFKVFYRWGEAIQGIGLAALIAAILILISKSKWFYASLGIILAFVQPFLRAFFENDFIATNYPLMSFNVVSLFLNSTIRGFFSLTHVLPMLLLGVVLGAMVIKSGRKARRASFIIGMFLMLASIIMHFSIDKIDIFNWSSAYQIGFSGFSFFVFALIEYFIVGLKRIAGFFSLFGKTAIVAYVLHFVVIYKPLAVFGFENMLNQPAAYLLTLISVIILYYACKIWLLNKKSFSRLIFR